MRSPVATDRITPWPTTPESLVGKRYGRFSPDGSEFVITSPRTPRPWANIIANPRFGLAITQSGSGFTWIDNSQLAVITRWQQDLVQDSSGKFLYARDADSGVVWSLAPAPVWPVYDSYLCRHGMGYTVFETEFAGIRASWTITIHPDQTAEVWLVTLTNAAEESRRIELSAFLEWCCGVAPSPRREFHKLFIETRFDPDRRAIYARNHMWEVPDPRFGHWNKDFPYTSAFASTEPVLSAQGDKAGFVGAYNGLARPEALGEETWKARFGRHEDPVAALRSAILLKPGESKSVGYVLAADEQAPALDAMLDGLLDVEAIADCRDRTRDQWRRLLARHRIDSPDASVNYLANDWLRYQAISGRIWGRCGYYQQSGAYGFRDQLQDSQVWLTIDPQRCREQIKLHAEHQFADGSVYHWWHPLSEQGHVTKMTDDLLWLAFVSASYIKETGDLSVLDERVRFIDDESPVAIRDHVRRAFERVFRRTSARGIPFIGAGDWNDGLSAAGLEERGESFWLAEFLAGLLRDWSHINAQLGDEATAKDYLARHKALVAAINKHGWDGEWYLRATLDNGQTLGSVKNAVAKIFLNAQTWAILNDIAPPDRAARCMAAVKKHLVREVGALLLAPAFDKPVPEVGYITRYAPGQRENGGVYTHAATWAIAAACKSRDSELAGALLVAINPANKDPDRYCTEPYVTPGNVEGPASPHFGRAGWTWYTGSAAWLHRVICEWVLGVRPEWDGLRIDPVLPPDWPGASTTRPWRGSMYNIRIERVAKLDGNAPRVTLDGNALPTNLIPPPTKSGETHEIIVTC